MNLYLTIKAPQIIMICLMAWSIVYNAIMHGKTTERKFNVLVTIADLVIITLILFWGGFF